MKTADLRQLVWADQAAISLWWETTLPATNDRLSPAELRQLIEKIGAEDFEVAEWWNLVFQAPSKDDVPPEQPKDRSKEEHEKVEAAWHSAREVKTNRAGLLHPDAAFLIAQALQKRDVQVTPDEVAEAKNNG